MSFAFTLDMTDLTRYADRLEQAAGDISLAGRSALFQASTKVVQTAKQLVPVRTGNLRDSIGLAPGTEGGRTGTALVSVVATAPYAGYVEFGTVHMAPRPYMRPALARHKGEAQDGIMAAAVQLLGTKTAARKALAGAVPRGTGFSASEQLGRLTG